MGVLVNPFILGAGGPPPPVAPTDATITPTGAAIEYNTGNRIYPYAARLDATHWLLVYAGTGGDGFAVVQEIDGAGVMTDVGTPFEFDPVGIGEMYPVVALGATSGLALVIHRGIDNDGFAQALNVNPTTWEVTSLGADFEFEIASFLSPEITHISGDRFLAVIRGDANDGWAYTLEVTAGAVSTLSSFEFDTASGFGPAVAKIDDEHYLVVYETSSQDGMVRVLAVNATTGVLSEASALEFNTTEARFNSVVRLDATHYLVTYADVTAAQGYSQVFEVNLSTWEVTLLGTRTAIPPTTFDVSGEQPTTLSVFTEIEGTYVVGRAHRSAIGIVVDILLIDDATWTVTLAASSETTVSAVSTMIHPHIRRVTDNRFVIWWHDSVSWNGYVRTFDWAPA